MENKDLKKIFGEWMCEMLSTPIVKAGIHANIGKDYDRDYILVANLYDGLWSAKEISLKTINGAKEGYIQFNKYLLETIIPFDDRKKDISDAIDVNAEILKERWIKVFTDKGIKITQ